VDEEAEEEVEKEVDFIEEMWLEGPEGAIP
jgi:hypothetical protein